MKPYDFRPGRDHGFTLLEILVALLVFAIMSVLAYAGLERILEGRDQVEVERNRWRALALANAQIEDDLAQSLGRAVRDVDGSVIPPFRGQAVDPRALALPSIELTRGGVFVSGNGTVSDMQRIGYRLREHELIRLTWTNLDRAPTEQPREIVLLSNVDNLSVRFHAPGGSWSDQWPPLNTPAAQTPITPDAVELAFDVAGVGRITRMLPVAQ